MILSPSCCILQQYKESAGRHQLSTISAWNFQKCKRQVGNSKPWYHGCICSSLTPLVYVYSVYVTIGSPRIGTFYHNWTYQWRLAENKITVFVTISETTNFRKSSEGDHFSKNEDLSDIVAKLVSRLVGGGNVENYILCPETCLPPWK